MKQLCSLVLIMLLATLSLYGCSPLQQNKGTSQPEGGLQTMPEKINSSYVLSVEPADGSRNQPSRDLYVKIKFSSLVSLSSINANPSLPANIYVVPTSELEQVRGSANNLNGAIYDCAISKQQPGVSFKLPELKANTSYTILIRYLQSTDGSILPEYTSTFATE